MPESEMARRIIELVGGSENVVRVTHCYSRLRFTLRDDGHADDAQLRTLPGVVIVMHQSGQLQVALGSGVGRVFDAVQEGLVT